MPLYDATAPIVCSLEGGEVQERIGQFERLRTEVQRVERTEHGLLLHFVASPDPEAELRRFAVAEKQCCGFWGFAVETAPGALRLVWDAPPNAEELVDRLADYLDGSGSSDIAGLL